LSVCNFLIQLRKKTERGLVNNVANLRSRRINLDTYLKQGDNGGEELEVAVSSTAPA
jgi:hypothetical protein